jgi:hypothetical protein
MSNVKCNAKDPASCRYHRPDAGEIALAALEGAKIALDDADRRLAAGEDNALEVLDLRWAVDRAEEAYYGTEMGVADIQNQMKHESDENEKFALEMKLANAKYALADAERLNAINERNGGPLIPAGSHTYEGGTVESGGNDLWPTSTGSKYQSGLRASQIKTLVNADIKEAQKKGYLPKHVKFAIRSRRDTLDVTIIGASKEQVYNNPDDVRRNDYTKQGSELLNRVQGIVRAYQYSQYDYIEGRTNSTNFWDHVNYESEWEKTLREEKEAAAAERKATKKAA